MVSISDGKVIGCSERQGQNGSYYLISVVIDGEAVQFMANKDIYEVAKSLEFGEERKVVLDLRRFGRDWSIRIIDLETY